MEKKLFLNNPLVIPVYDFWGNLTYQPAVSHAKNKAKRIVKSAAKSFLSGFDALQRKKMQYLNKHCIPSNCQVEGVEEFPCVLPYCESSLPLGVVGLDETIPRNSFKMGLHGFCYDYVLEAKWRNMDRLIDKAKHYMCAFGLDFSIPVDGRRCDIVEAIRRNRIATLFMQQSGIPTIQTASWGNVDTFGIAFDGLAANCPVAIEHNVDGKNPAKRKLFRLGVEELIRRKSPTVLIVLGFPLNFDPGVPVVYYKSRIQKLRENYG